MAASQLQWVVTAYSVTFGGLLLTTGNLGDRIGRRRILAIGLSVMGAGSLLVLTVSDANLLVAIRALIGVGAALAMPSTLSLLYTTFTGAARQKAIGLWSVFGMLGPVCGPIIGGILLEHAGWQWLFLINVPVALIAVPLVLLVVRESTSPTQEPLDVPGALLSIAFMGMLVYGLGAGPDAGWLSTRVLLSLGAAVLLLAAFCWRELRAEHPMLDLRLIASRAFAVPALVEGATFVGMVGAMFVQTQLVQTVLGLTPLQAGLAQLPAVVVVALANVPITRFATTHSPRVLISVGLAVLGTGAGVIAAWPSSLVGVMAGMAVLMIGMRMALPAAAMLVIDALPPERAGIGSALNDTFQEIGGAIGVAVAAAFLTHAYRTELAPGAPAAVVESVFGAAAYPEWVTQANAAFAHGASVSFTAMAVTQLVVAGIAWFILRPVVTHEPKAQEVQVP